MKILIFGARGMLGHELAGVLSPRFSVTAADLAEADITEFARVQDLVGAAAPDVVINAAAYTDVDGCEADPAKAFAVNARGAGNIARACAAGGSRMIHFSTDYVFDGAARRPYREEDLPAPAGVYGRSKWEGERRVQEILADHLIIRTAWLYGAYGKNFVAAILKQAENVRELRVVDDQRGSPTFARDLAAAVAALLACAYRGLLHVTNAGSCTWCAYARRILQLAGKTRVQVVPISTAELNRPAPRPAYSVLDCSRFSELTGCSMRPWTEALKAYLGNAGKGPPAPVLTRAQINRTEDSHDNGA